MLGNADLVASLHFLYFILEEEDEVGFNLIFDYPHTLLTSAEELNALPQNVLDRASAVLAFNDVVARGRGVEAIHRSLWATGLG